MDEEIVTHELPNRIRLRQRERSQLQARLNNIGRSNLLGYGRHRGFLGLEQAERSLAVGGERLEFMPATEDETGAAGAADNRKAGHGDYFSLVRSGVSPAF